MSNPVWQIPRSNVSPPDLDVLSESALATAQATIQNAIDQAQISRADLARSMERPRSFITRMLSGGHNLTIKTMARAILACGYEIQFSLAPIVWNWTAEPVVQRTVTQQCQVPSQEGTLVLAN